MPPELLNLAGPFFGFAGVAAAAFFGLRGSNRAARASEKVSSDSLTNELVGEYRVLKDELKADMTERLENEKRERIALSEKFEAKLAEILEATKGVEEYVTWCVNGHTPPPKEPPHKALKKLRDLYK